MASASKPCPPGCTCRKHSDEYRAALSERAREQAARERAEGKESRSERLKRVWASRTPEERQAIAAKVLASRGRWKDSDQTRARKSVAQQKRWEGQTAEQRRAFMDPAMRTRGAKKCTELEASVAAALDFLGLAYEFQPVVAGKWVDFLVPSLNMVIEADGAYWHQDPDRDAERDQAIESSGVSVVRVSEAAVNEHPVRAVFNAILKGHARGI